MDYLVILSGLTFFGVCLTATFFKISLDKNKITNALILKNQNLITSALSQMKNYQTTLLSELAKHEQQNNLKIDSAVIALNDLINTKNNTLNLLLENNNNLLKLTIKSTTDDIRKELQEFSLRMDQTNLTLNKKIDNLNTKIVELSQLEEIK